MINVKDIIEFLKRVFRCFLCKSNCRSNCICGEKQIKKEEETK